MNFRKRRGLIVLLPSLRISGGVQEALRLANDLVERGVEVRVIALWKHQHESPGSKLQVEYLSDFVPRKAWAAFQFPLLLLRFVTYMMRLRKEPEWSFPTLLLTHFSTFPFAWLTPALGRFCFNQDLEWKFVPVPCQTLVRWLVLFTSRRSKVITTNEFVSHCYVELEVEPYAQASIWASSFWLGCIPAAHRPFDIGILLRHGSVKRPELYFELLNLIRKETSIRCAVVTPEDNLYQQAKQLVEHVLLRPSNQELRAFYGSCKIFVLLSDTEGFGLPPLEAMASGCVPLCRDSGGVRCYMKGSFGDSLVSAGECIPEILERIRSLLCRADELVTLSHRARACFADGLRDSKAERDEALDRIAADLLGTMRG